MSVGGGGGGVDAGGAEVLVLVGDGVEVFDGDELDEEVGVRLLLEDFVGDGVRY